MITVVHQGKVYQCSVAIKGPDYVHLLDARGDMCTAFDGVNDFSTFMISGGPWTTPTEDHDCFVAVVRDDGSVGKGGHRCCELLKTGEWSGWQNARDEVLEAGEKVYQVRVELSDYTVLHVAPFELIDDAVDEQIVATFMRVVNGVVCHGYIYASRGTFRWALNGKCTHTDGTLVDERFMYQYRELGSTSPVDFAIGDGVEY